MTPDKNETNQSNTTLPQQAQADRDAPMNPFKEATATETPETAEEESALEQQRKEALTERD